MRRAAAARFSAARASSTSSSDSARSNLTVIPGDYRLGGTLLGVSLFLGPVCHLGTQCLVHGLLGAFLLLQASRVRFRFSDQQLDVVFVQPGASDDDAKQADTASSGDNQLQGGGANAWSLAAITNWEFWWPGFPVLVYYKETQTVRAAAARWCWQRASRERLRAVCALMVADSHFTASGRTASLFPYHHEWQEIIR